jgi:prepilin-type processing-associated H-X9-DG protein
MNAKVNITKKDLIIILCCVAFLLLNFSAVNYRGRERAKIIVCQTNLKMIGQAQFLYLDDNDDCYPNPWTCLVASQSSSLRNCQWHNSRYPLDGPLFLPYIEKNKVLLCPTFNTIAKQIGQEHPMHDISIPIVPQYSYSMNARLGSRTGCVSGGVLKRSEITRNKAEVFFFAEENIWLRPGCNTVLNDTALCPDGRDWFGTFHNTTSDNLNAGTVNVVFVDGHVQQVSSALKADPSDTSEMEFGQFEKYGWPFQEPYR